jgi:hypothetical protein
VALIPRSVTPFWRGEASRGGRSWHPRQDEGGRGGVAIGQRFARSSRNTERAVGRSLRLPSPVAWRPLPVAFNRELCHKVRKIFVRTVLGFLTRQPSCCIANGSPVDGFLIQASHLALVGRWHLECTFHRW